MSFYDLSSLDRLEEYVDKRYKDHLKNQGKVDSVSFLYQINLSFCHFYW